MLFQNLLRLWIVELFSDHGRAIVSCDEKIQQISAVKFFQRWPLVVRLQPSDPVYEAWFDCMGYRARWVNPGWRHCNDRAQAEVPPVFECGFDDSRRDSK